MIAANLKVGDNLIAIDECMMDCGIQALIIGKKYEIKHVNFNDGYNFIAIESEYNLYMKSMGKHSVNHGFRIKDLSNYFKIDSQAKNLN